MRRTGLFAQAASHTGLGFVKAGDGLPINVKHGERFAVPEQLRQMAAHGAAYYEPAAKPLAHS